MSENWEQGRWAETVKKSNWHFDLTKPAEPGLDSYTHVCRFTNDFSELVEQLKPLTVNATWDTRQYYNNISEKALNAEQQDLLNAGADPNMEVFARMEAHDVELFQKIAAWLGIDSAFIKFHNQKTGQMLVEHIDNFAGFKDKKGDSPTADLYQEPHLVRRFAIMLDDWKLGQVFQLGNANFHQWRAGDCITWEWQDIPHATGNMGWWDRPMLQITGYVTDKTNEILKEASKFVEIEI